MAKPKQTSWVYEHFCDARESWGNYRICRICNPVLPEDTVIAGMVARGEHPGRMFQGVCQILGSSPSSLINHVRNKHPECFARGYVSFADGGAEAGNPNPAKIDMELMTEWAEHVCLRCLLPVSTITDMRPVLASRLRGLGGETKLQECVDAVVDSIRGEVTAELKSAQESGCKFCLSADTWKPKSKRRQNFLAMYLDFTKDFQHRSVCLAVKVAEAPKTWEKYCQLFLDALKAAGLSTKDLMAGLSDHRSSIRKGLRLLNVPLVGCGAHAVQLCPKHCLPLLRERSSYCI